MKFVPRTFKGDWQGSAKKAINRICRDMKLGGVEKGGPCTKYITLREVFPSGHNKMMIPALDSEGQEIRRGYQVNRVLRDIPKKPKVFDPDVFKYKAIIVQSYGRV
jgi:hypothetical protein